MRPTCRAKVHQINVDAQAREQAVAVLVEVDTLKLGAGWGTAVEALARWPLRADSAAAPPVGTAGSLADDGG